MATNFKPGDRIIALDWDINLVYKGDIGTVQGTGLRDYTHPYVSARFTSYGGKVTVLASPAANKVAVCTCDTLPTDKAERFAHADYHASKEN